jgi:hypothetical protein
MPLDPLVPVPYPALTWPVRFAPHEAPVFVHNHRLINAPQAVVWAWLVRARGWPTWYPNSSRVTLYWEGAPYPGSVLRTGMLFRWCTFRLRIRSRVHVLDQQAGMLAWDGTGLGARVYHAWCLVPQADGSTLVVTEETQWGLGARLVHYLCPRRMWDGHALWLERLAAQAQQGMPPDAER